MTTQLIRYEAACHAIAECVRVDEVKEWADKAAAMQAYGRMAKDKSLEVDAAEIRIRAERRLGELLAAQKAEGGLAKPGPKSVVSNDRTPTLAAAGISKDLSSRAQKLAAVPPAEFEAELAAKRERDRQEGARVTARLEKAGERELKKTAPPPADDEHDGFDPLAELERAHAEIQALTETVKAAEADDLKAEAMKWRKAYDHALRQQSEAMTRAKESTDREAWTMRQLRRCGKAVGQDDPTKIAAAVEAMARTNKVAA